MRSILSICLGILPLLSLAQRKSAVNVEMLKQARLDTIVSMLQITAMDTVVDIGSGNGSNLIRLSKYFPLVRYHVEDIDSSTCNRRNFEKMIRAYNPAISIDSFSFHYGTVTATLLPRASFTKVLMIAVLHEFDSRDEMLSDIKSILKPGGFIFIEEPLTTTPGPVEKGCNNPYLTEPAFREILQRNRIEIVQEKSIMDAGNGRRFRKFFKCRVLQSI